MRSTLTKRHPWRRQLAFRPAIAGLAALTVLAGCGNIGDIRLGRDGYGGAVVADEPRAALVGREVLLSGGSAGDAAVATYFALSVTLPTAAGLGGGGVCIGYDPTRQRLEVIDFMPRPTAGGGVAVPANVRGMALLHSRFGVQPWAQLLGPAEQMARIGTETSRALAVELAQAVPAIAGDPQLLRLFTASDGRTLGEGQMSRQPDLAGVLARVRTTGAGDFYSGQTARQIVEGAAAIGVDLTLDDLRRFVPQTRAPITLPTGPHRIALPGVAGGPLAADMIAAVEAVGYRGASQPERVQIMAAAVRRSYAAATERVGGEPGSTSRGRALMADYRAGQASAPQAIRLSREAAAPAASFVTFDGARSAVACTVTMGGAFGTGRVVPGTGMALAPAAAGAALSMAPLLVVNTNTERSLLALASGGGRYAAAAAAEMLLGLMVEKRTLEVMIQRPRVADDGQTVLLEPEADDSAEALQRAGNRLREEASIGHVNAVFCSPDLPADTKACEARPDPRGAGLAAPR